MWEQFKNLFLELVGEDEAKKSKVQSAFANFKEPNPEPPTGGSSSKEYKDLLAQYQAQKAVNEDLNKKLDQLLTIQSEAQKKEEERAKLLEEEAKAKRMKEIEDLIKEAETKGVIAPKDESQKNTYKALLEKDYENTKKLIDEKVKEVESKVPNRQDAGKATGGTGKPTSILGAAANPKLLAHIQESLKN
jgi:hypothetical protein